jgi:hypothetical protein
MSPGHPLALQDPYENEYRLMPEAGPSAIAD